MSYANRVWMAASVAVVNSHSEQWQKINSGLNSLNHGKKRFLSGADAVDLRPISAVFSSGLGGLFLGGGEDKGKQAEKSLHEVMYFNCWGPS